MTLGVVVTITISRANEKKQNRIGNARLLCVMCTFVITVCVCVCVCVCAVVCMYACVCVYI